MRLHRLTFAGALFLTAVGCAQETTGPAGPSPEVCAVSLAASRTGFQTSGGTATVTVSANGRCGWTLGHPSWVTVSPVTSGVGPAELTMTVSAGPDRTGLLTAGDAQLQVTRSSDVFDIYGAGCPPAMPGARGFCTANLTSKKTSSRMSVDLSGLGLSSDMQVPAVQGCATCFDLDFRVPEGAQPGPVQVRFRFDDGPGRVATATATFTVLPK